MQVESGGATNTMGTLEPSFDQVMTQEPKKSNQLSKEKAFKARTKQIAAK